MQRHIAIFIDWENIEKAVKQSYGGILLYDAFSQIIKRHNQDKIISGIFAYGDFDKGEAGIQTKLIRLGIVPKHVVTKTAHEYVKGAADIEISLDMIQNLYDNPHITDYMIISGDGDLLHVIKRLRLKGKTVHVMSFKESTNKLMMETVDTFTDLADFHSDITKKITETELEKRIKTALHNEWVENVLTYLEFLQKDSKRTFIGLNFFRKKLIEKYSPIAISEALTECLELSLIVTYPVDNPKDPNNPTTACRLNELYNK